MLNTKWLKISMFIPIFGTIINCVILFVQSLKQKNISRIKIGLCMAVCAIAFLMGNIVCALVFKILSVSIAPQIRLICSFVLSGFLMNIVFWIYYKKAFAMCDDG